MFKRNLNLILLLLLVTFWSGSFIGIKYAILAWPPFFSAAVRVFISLITIRVLIIIYRKETKIQFQLRWRVWILGIFALGISFASLFWGERFISPGLAGILNSTTMIWTFLISICIFKKEIPFLYIKLFGVILGFTGIITIFWPMLTFENSRWELWGSIAVIIMAISYAIAGILAQRFFKDYGKLDLLTNLYHQCWSALFFLLLLSLCFEHWPSWHTASKDYAAIIGTIYLGVFSTGFSWLIYYHLIREWGAVRASIAPYIVPIGALITDYLFFHHVPLLSQCIGVVIILLAIFVINYRKRELP